MEWAESGGTLRPDWKIPDFTPKEAEQLRFVDKKGRPIPGFNPDEETRLSGAATAQRGQERAAALRKAGYDVPTDDPQINYGRLTAREEMLQHRIAEKGSRPGLERRLARVQKRRANVGRRLGVTEE